MANKSVHVLEPISADYQRGLGEHAYTKLRDAILSGRFAAGRRLRERQLAAELGVSTTPVKQALQRLELEGLIVTAPRRGSFVCHSTEKAAEMALIRASLESVVARLAAQKITDAEIKLLGAHLAAMRTATHSDDYEAVVAANSLFHSLIYSIADNAYLSKLLETLRDSAEVARRQALRSRAETESGLAEHTQIFDALSAHDGDRAEQAMRQHVLRSSETAAAEAIPHNESNDLSRERKAS